MDVKIIEPIRKYIKEFNSTEEFNDYYSMHKEEMDNLTTHKLNKMYHVVGYRITKIKGVLMLKRWDTKQESEEENPLKQEISTVQNEFSTFRNDMSAFKQNLTSTKEDFTNKLSEVTNLKSEISRLKDSIVDINVEIKKIKSSLLEVINFLNGEQK